MTWLYLQIANQLGKHLNTLLLSMLMDQSPFLFSDECCPLLLMVSGRRDQLHIQRWGRKEENWCHPQSHKLNQWPLFPLVPPLALHLAMCLWPPGQWRRRELLKIATSIWIQASGAIYLNTTHVPYTATSQLLWQLPRNKKCALSSCDISHSKLCPVADGSFLKLTYWLWAHVRVSMIVFSILSSSSVIPFPLSSDAQTLSNWKQ